MHLHRAVEARQSVRELGGDVVVFFNAPLEVIRDWRRRADDVPADLEVIADPDALVYKALGTVRKSVGSMLASTPGAVLKAARAGRLPRLTRTDMLRQGADAAVRADGEIAKLHLAQAPADRLETADLVASLA
jgi:hypothetical protein